MNADSPEFKNEVCSHIQARIAAAFEAAGFERETHFALVSKPLLACKKFLVLGDRLHNKYTINVQVKSLDCSIRIAVINKETKDVTDLFVGHEPLRFKISDNPEQGKPTAKSEAIIQSAIECLQHALPLDGNPSDWIRLVPVKTEEVF
jgi:hypothetical protein